MNAPRRIFLADFELPDNLAGPSAVARWSLEHIVWLQGGRAQRAFGKLRSSQ